MKNYYEILQVNKNASPEVIEKVYKMLVKEYHPDLHPEGRKQFAEEQIKLINEAYDILSNKEKRKNYNKSLEENFVDIEKYNLIINENIKLKNELNDIKLKINNYNNLNNNINNSYYSSDKNYSKNNFYENNINYNYAKKTNNNYNNSNYYYNQNLNFKEKIKNLFKNIFAIFITFIIIFIIFQIPFFKNILFSLNFGSGLFIIPVIVLFIYFMGKR